MRIAVSVFVIASLGFFVYTLVDAWKDTNGELPSASRLIGAGALWAVGLVAGAFAWSELLGGAKGHHRAAFVVSQLGKYVPGGIVQVTGQIGLARSAGVRVKRAATAAWVLAMTQAIGGFVWVLVLALTWSNAQVVLRVVLAVGALVSLALIDRRWMVWALRRIPRTREAAQDLVPNQGSIAIASIACTVTLGAASGAYLVLLGSFGAVGNPLFVMAAFGAAWTVGYIAIPIPAGLGIREALLAAMLHGLFPASVIVAASVYLRLVLAATEGLGALAVSRRVRPSRLAAVRTAMADADAGPVQEESADEVLGDPTDDEVSLAQDDA